MQLKGKSVNTEIHNVYAHSNDIAHKIWKLIPWTFHEDLTETRDLVWAITIILLAEDENE